MNTFFLVTALFILSTKNASAYLDPGTGSYMLQLLIGGALGGMFVIKSSWQAIKSALFRHQKELQENESESNKE